MVTNSTHSYRVNVRLVSRKCLLTHSISNVPQLQCLQPSPHLAVFYFNFNHTECNHLKVHIINWLQSNIKHVAAAPVKKVICFSALWNYPQYNRLTNDSVTTEIHSEFVQSYSLQKVYNSSNVSVQFSDTRNLISVLSFIPFPTVLVIFQIKTSRIKVTVHRQNLWYISMKLASTQFHKLCNTCSSL